MPSFLILQSGCYKEILVRVSSVPMSTKNLRNFISEACLVDDVDFLPRYSTQTRITYESRKGKNMSQNYIPKSSTADQSSRKQGTGAAASLAYGISLCLLGWFMHIGFLWFWKQTFVVSLGFSHFFVYIFQFVSWSMVALGCLQLLATFLLALYQWIRTKKA